MRARPGRRALKQAEANQMPSTKASSAGQAIVQKTEGREGDEGLQTCHDHSVGFGPAADYGVRLAHSARTSSVCLQRFAYTLDTLWLDLGLP
mmetsp:Transcript_123434/g.214036  ORF Transcript_123434/g.214036 Transcript_123434/m.214036 type:complete len:92 (+) Transcript_123434:308-583(+)